MTVLAIALVLVAAVIHATWNLIAKQAERAGGGATFVWLTSLFGTLLYFPLALYFTLRAPSGSAFSGEALRAILGSALLHLGYYLLLQKGYRIGDLSLVYPVARGVAPLLATAGAIALFGERPSVTALLGAALISASVFLLAGTRGEGKDAAASRRAVKYGLGIAALIATYTLWDKNAVSVWLVSPVLLDWGSHAVRTVLMLPYIVPRWSITRAEWKANGKRALLVGALSPLAYILVLQALTFTPASYIAPAREVSILVGTLMGARFLHEGNTWRRLAGACGMVAALVALSLG